MNGGLVNQIVIQTTDGRTGVICPNLPPPIGDPVNDDEVVVAFEGNTFIEPVKIADLKVIGPEEAIADPEKCGAGKGEDCCIFLIMGSKDFECQRHGPMRNQLIFATMQAKRHPVELYPKCQLN